MSQLRQAPTVASAGGADVIASVAAAYTPANPTVPIASTAATAALPSISSLRDWLVSLRITPKDAREYTVALTDLGFDDLQSLQEDATEADLRQAGMKPGHLRRVSRALSIHAHLRQHANIDAVHSPLGSPIKNFRPANSKARLAGTKESCKNFEGINGGGGGVVLRACSSCVLTCDGGHRSQHRLAIAPVSGNDVIAVRYVDSNNVVVGGENAVLPVNGAESLVAAGPATKVAPMMQPCRDLGVAKFGERGAEGVDRASVKESKSASDGTPDVISKEVGFASSSGESSDEDFAANLSSGRSGNAAAFASSGGILDPGASAKDSGRSHTGSSSRRRLTKSRRVSLSVHAKVRGIADGNRRGTSQPLPRIMNLDASTAATARQRGRYDHPLQRARSPRIDIDPVDSHAFERVARSSASIRRTRLRSSNSATRSMSLVPARPGSLLERTQSERTSSLRRGAEFRGAEDANQCEQSVIPDPPEFVFRLGDADTASRSRGLDANEGAGSGAADGRLPPELQCLRDLEPSYDFSDSGTLQMHGFVLKPDGMKSVPTLTPILRDRGSCAETNHGSCSRPSYDDGIRDLRPPTLQTCFGSTGRFPCSRDSNFGGDGAESLRDGFSGCSGYGSSWSNVVMLPPLTKTATTPTPRRTREATILLEQIGRGGGGTVYKALHVPSMRLVAVKMVEVYEDEKRRQMIKELRALLSMNWVPLTLPSDRFGTHDGGRNHPTDEWSVGSLESSGTCGGWPDADDDGSPVPGHGEMNRVESFTVTDGGKTSTAATATVTPPTLLSTRDGGSAGVARHVFDDRETGFEIGRRVTSACGFAPWSRGSSGKGTRSYRRDLSLQREDNKMSAGIKGGVGGNGNGSRRDFPVVAFHDAYTDVERGSVCMVMEYMDGGTLEAFIRRREALSESALAVVARSVLRGLVEMHANHQIHRDIKPSNILLDRQGRIKISDFGIVRELSRTVSLAQTFTGTLLYMSPERITETDYSYPSDVWSLGMVMAALALGRFPLNMSPKGGYFEIVQAITEEPVPALHHEAFSEELCDFVEQMLRRRASDRPSAACLLNHPFLKQNDGCHKLVGMVKVAPASHVEVQSLLTKLAEYRLGEAFDREVSLSLWKDVNSLGSSTPRPRMLPRLFKADVGFLAGQLQVTKADLVEEYDIICKRAEEGLSWGKNNSNGGNNKQQHQQDPFTKTRGRFLGGESGCDRRDTVSRQFPTIHKSRAPPLRSKSSPLPSLDLVFPDRNLLCETPSTAGSAFYSSASSRQRDDDPKVLHSGSSLPGVDVLHSGSSHILLYHAPDRVGGRRAARRSRDSF